MSLLQAVATISVIKQAANVQVCQVAGCCQCSGLCWCHRFHHDACKLEAPQRCRPAENEQWLPVGCNKLVNIKLDLPQPGHALQQRGVQV